MMNNPSVFTASNQLHTLITFWIRDFSRLSIRWSTNVSLSSCQPQAVKSCLPECLPHNLVNHYATLILIGLTPEDEENNPPVCLSISGVHSSLTRLLRCLQQIFRLKDPIQLPITRSLYFCLNLSKMNLATKLAIFGIILLVCISVNAYRLPRHFMM